MVRMTVSAQIDYTHRLRSHMQAVNLSSFKALSDQADVSTWQIQQLRQGKAHQMRVEQVQRLSQALNLPLVEMLQQFSPLAADSTSSASTVSKKSEESEVPNTSASSTPAIAEKALDSSHAPASHASASADLDVLRREYGRLQQQLQQQEAQLRQQFQRECVQILESWLIQWPTAAYAAQQNSQVPAARLLPLIRPIQQLLEHWGIVAIATIGAEVPYDPQRHQLMGGTASPGDLVRVRYTGYCQGDTLLYRAKVSPVQPSES